MSDWKDDIVHWARRNKDIWELWLLSQNVEATDALTIGVVLAPADGDHSRALGDFSLLDVRWRSELRTIARRQVRLEPMVPGYPGDTFEPPAPVSGRGRSYFVADTAGFTV
jgi:hypothetical protein